MAEMSVFQVLNSINCNEHTEQKNGLTYLSWAWAWQMVKQNFPDATYTIYENKDGLLYHTDGKTAWVKTGVTINGLEHIEYLPVMDFKNKSITIDQITSFEVNKAVQRSLTKACARHGLGLYIYAGEDLPDGDSKVTPAPKLSEKEQDDLALAIDEIKHCKSIDELTDVAKKWKGFQNIRYSVQLIKSFPILVYALLIVLNESNRGNR